MYHFNVSPLGYRNVEIHQLEFRILEHTHKIKFFTALKYLQQTIP
jgi:hypothetical protein